MNYIKFKKVKRSNVQKFLASYAISFDVSEACKDAGISFFDFLDLLDSDIQFRADFQKIRSGLAFVAELELIKKMQEGDTRAIMFFLSENGRVAGYNADPEGQKQDEALKVEIEFVGDEKPKHELTEEDFKE